MHNLSLPQLLSTHPIRPHVLHVAPNSTALHACPSKTPNPERPPPPTLTIQRRQSPLPILHPHVPRAPLPTTRPVASEATHDRTLNIVIPVREILQGTLDAVTRRVQSEFIQLSGEVNAEKVAHQNTLSKYDLLCARLRDLLSECELASSNRELLCSELAKVAREIRFLKEHVRWVMGELHEVKAKCQSDIEDVLHQEIGSTTSIPDITNRIQRQMTMKIFGRVDDSMSSYPSHGRFSDSNNLLPSSF